MLVDGDRTGDRTCINCGCIQLALAPMPVAQAHHESKMRNVRQHMSPRVRDRA
jgi:hypothetical protein